VNSNLILEEEANYKEALSSSSKEEEEDSNIKEYTEALKRGEWIYNFKEY
jgi:hypothetical protein